MLYLDSSAVLKLFIDEADSASCQNLLAGDSQWVTGRHTEVEVRRNLCRLIDGLALAEAQRDFREVWGHMAVVQLDELTCSIAADIAELTGVRSLDALHLGAASRLGVTAVTFVTYDVRQAQAARSLHMQVVGA